VFEFEDFEVMVGSEEGIEGFISGEVLVEEDHFLGVRVEVQLVSFEESVFFEKSVVLVL